MSKCGSNGCAAPSMTLSEPKTADAPLTRALYRIENMDCPTEEALIRDKLSKLPGITGLEFNLIQRTLAVSHKLPSLAPVEQALSAIGMRALRADEAPAYPVSYTHLAIGGAGQPLDTILRSFIEAGVGAAVVGISCAHCRETEYRACNNQFGRFHDDFLYTGIRLAYCFALMGSRVSSGAREC